MSFLFKDVRITLQNGVILDGHVSSIDNLSYVLTNVSSGDTGGMSIPSLRIEKNKIKQISVRVPHVGAITVVKPEQVTSNAQAGTSDSFTQVVSKKKPKEKTVQPTSTATVEPASPAVTPAQSKPRMDQMSLAARQIKYILEFKTVMCAEVLRVKWCSDRFCFFAHNAYELRRVPTRYIYSPEDCPDFRLSPDNCPRGNKCPWAHGRYEIMYHPEIFKTKTCEDYMKKNSCPRAEGCAFAHGVRELRKPVPIEQFASLVDSMPEFRQGGGVSSGSAPVTATPAAASGVVATKPSSSGEPVVSANARVSAGGSASAAQQQQQRTTQQQQPTMAHPMMPMMISTGGAMPLGAGPFVAAGSSAPGGMPYMMPYYSTPAGTFAAVPGMPYMVPFAPAAAAAAGGGSVLFMQPPGAAAAASFGGPAQFGVGGGGPFFVPVTGTPLMQQPVPYNPLRAQMSAAAKNAGGTVDTVSDAMKNLNIEPTRSPHLVDASCNICFEDRADCLVLPCAHLFFCMKCIEAHKLRASKENKEFDCPYCRSPVSNFVKVHSN